MHMMHSDKLTLSPTVTVVPTVTLSVSCMGIMVMCVMHFTLLSALHTILPTHTLSETDATWLINNQMVTSLPAMTQVENWEDIESHQDHWQLFPTSSPLCPWRQWGQVTPHSPPALHCAAWLQGGESQAVTLATSRCVLWKLYNGAMKQSSGVLIYIILSDQVWTGVTTGDFSLHINIWLHYTSQAWGRGSILTTHNTMPMLR